MRTIIVIVFVITTTIFGINIIKDFASTIKNHNQRIERAAGY